MDTVVLRESTAVMDFNTDEINQIRVNEKGAFVAACDDSGEIKVMDVRKGHALFKTLRGHDNICASIVFRPRTSWDLLSGTHTNI
jgi:WD40 repeat protein